MANPALSPVIARATTQIESLDSIDPEPASKKPRAGHSVDPETAAKGLTTEAKSLIASIAAGESHEEMAAARAISEQALASEIAQLCRKMSVANEFELILFSLAKHLLDAAETHTEAGSQA